MMSHSIYSAASQTARTDTSPWAGLFVLQDPGYERSKRLIDVLGSLCSLILLAPLLLAIVACIKGSGRGPILFRQKRLGRGGKLFWCYKFRTMVPDAESQLARRRDLLAQFHENYKLKSDPRITPVGAILRRTSLDELPQLWNVLRGDMSLIGPRPIVEPELSKYGVHASRLLTVKPGLGGIWQVSGRSHTSYPDRVAMDMRYIESRSLGLDLKLLIQTALVVIQGRGAY
jgi:lipopolysaccharide/colanic/teichoic acid biosynthesis glycosyltransferase